jgi:hypothetical protein
MRSAIVMACAAALAAGAAPAARADPDCSGPDHWPANMTLAQLKNAGVIRSPEIDFERTASREIASQKIAPDRWRQVFEVTFHRKDGGKIEAIAVSDASSGECSMGEVTVYRIAPDPPPRP